MVEFIPPPPMLTVGRLIKELEQYDEGTLIFGSPSGTGLVYVIPTISSTKILALSVVKTTELHPRLDDWEEEGTRKIIMERTENMYEEGTGNWREEEDTADRTWPPKIETKTEDEK